MILFVAEVFGHRESRKGDAHTSTWRLIHLTVNQGDLRLAEILLVDNASFRHFVVKVITFTRALTHSSKHGVTTVAFGDVIDELHDDHGLTYTSTTKRTHFTTLGKRSDQIDDLNAGLKNFRTGILISEGRSSAVNRILFIVSHWATIIHGITGHIKDTAEHAFTHGN